MVGEAAGKALAVMASAVEDLPNVMGKDDVCKESFGRLLGAGCGARASISLAVSGFSEVRLFAVPWAPCVESAGAGELMARTSMSERGVLQEQDQIRTGMELCRTVTVRLVGRAG